ncbi:S-adenosyl-L-methionine-dependent methyltransferase [Aspergillus neoniger CBS 115656]|uniref:S-adenosyl-L-methionine-dependent methyltransferase n=1 Tax=Aspergillus neoniger (strain CBS 115656) TaxID=1448310 RepID=A0A318YB13_ASPNB|nr:S-adenosyl-L-methionine-dependent methyltransferase [Aspergillus neoniger CBS 115656]PYH29860.1 S-adenosyl-L-methionine-dependent methyltransferase [Aspergillus neoniger CBS 115656]
MAATDPEILLASLEELKCQLPTDEETQSRLSQALHHALMAIERPLDTVRRISFAPLQLTMTKVAMDLNLFELLVSDGRPKSLGELMELTGAQSLLLRRILRYLSGFDLVHEPKVDCFKASPATQALALPGFGAGINHHFEIQLPAWQTLPSFLAANEYRSPSDSSPTAFQQAHGTELTAFAWAMDKPHIFKEFSLWMTAQRHGQPTWMDVFPLDQLKCGRNNHTNTQYPEADVDGEEHEAPLFIDIGGGMGHQCFALVDRLGPELGTRRRIILKNIPAVLSHAISHPRIDRLVHDFWDPQPIWGASFYYMRNVLHDYPDDKCVQLLRLQSKAMAPDGSSSLLIDEIVFPETGAGPREVEMDLAMMACLAARERTKDKWDKLFRAARLSLFEVFTYASDLSQSIMVVKRLNPTG